ncbi:MAG: glycosyltransferase [Bacteroidales bacterium]|nr:glycosyltransferase [Bacteroidales bacterium]
MIIIEATQTFSPGNIELLIYILSQIEKRQVRAKVYLGHKYTFSLLSKEPYKYVCIEWSTPLKTLFRFFTKRKGVLFFNSFPPFIKHEKSIVYFHSTFFTDPKVFLRDRTIKIYNRVRRLIVYFQIRIFHSNVNLFFCQTKKINDKLKLNFKGIKSEIVPFYNDYELASLKYGIFPFEYDFFYPATVDAHKNYFRLFDSVAILGKKKQIKVCVTVDFSKIEYIQKIKEVNDLLGYESIVNVGRISKSEVIKLFTMTKALVFPSLEESLGLPLIEAASIGCPIIGSDLPYIYDVVKNPIVFDPFNIEVIATVMEKFINGEYDQVVQGNLIENRVDTIIDYFVKQQ